jgi:ABC-type branched-subunit amino acid transport system substrate-binding protein
MALSKIQSITLISILIIATGSVVAYVLLKEPKESSETVKIGVCADLDNSAGKSIYQEAVLAVEQINAEGGILGRLFEVVAEDDDSESGNMDAAFATNAFTKLITVDKADYVIAMGSFTTLYQELMFQHKTILFDAYNADDQSTQNVLDDYDKYKYYFRVGISNHTTISEGVTEDVVTIGEYTGFNKVAIVSYDMGLAGSDWLSDIVATLRDAKMDVVYTGIIPLTAVDFSSYFAQAEAAGTEIMHCPNILPQSGVPFVKEYHDRQSPMVVMGSITAAARNDFWEITEGKCEYVSYFAYSTGVGYPFTNKTLAFAEAYRDRWGEIGTGAVYDVVRYILPDAIKRAGTFETDAVIAALETVDVETSLARHFIFTSSHDIMSGKRGYDEHPEDYFFVGMFQWQNGVQVPVLPKEIMEEAGATYLVPDWPGPWDNIS